MDRESPSWQQWQAYRRAGQTRKAALIEKIAREPKALWLGRFTQPNFFVKVRRLIDPARGGGLGADLHRASRAGHRMLARATRAAVPAEDARTRAWYDDLARAIGSAAW